MKRIVLAFLCLLLVLAPFSGCSLEPAFSFSVRWGVSAPKEGSSYDSRTGTLVKTANASDPSKFRTRLKLDRRELDELARLAEAIDFSGIPEAPENYDPYSPENEKGETRAWSTPKMFLELTVRREGREHHVRCFGIPYDLLYPREEISERDPPPADENARAFETFVRRVLGTVFDSEEWQSLPPFEVLYE